MGVVAAVCDVFKTALLNGRSFSTDTIKIALYLSSGATLGKGTTVYTSTGEVSGTGYTAGGMALSGFTVGLSSDTAYLTWSNPTWAASSITADTALIYDSTNSNAAIAVLSFTSATSTNGNFTVQFPSPGISSTITLS